MGTPSASIGCTIKKGSTQILNVTSIQFGGRQREMIDSSDLDTDDLTYVAGQMEPGEISLTINYDPADATHVALFTDLDDKSADTYTVTYADAAAKTTSFSARVQSLNPVASRGSTLVLNAVLKLTGAITNPV